MRTEHHIFINSLLAALLYIPGIINLENALLFVLGGIFFDIDHFLFHIFSEKNISFRNFVDIHKKMFRNLEPGLYVFHTFEFLAFLVFMTVNYFPFLFYFTVGHIFHMILDTLRATYYHRTDFSWIKNWSLLWHIKNFIYHTTK